MRDRLTLSLQQRNPVVGDLEGNRRMAERAVADAGKVDLVVFTELFICGHPPEDLVLGHAFVEQAMAEVRTLAAAFADGPAIAIGTPWLEDGVITNACAVLKGGAVHALRHKVELPGGGLLDQKRLFAAGPMPGPVDIDGVRIGFPVGEDIRIEDVCECLAETGAELLVVPGGAPYARGGQDVRLQIALARVVETELPLVLVNQTGGQDELVFDGASFVLAADRTLAARLPAFQEAAQEVVFERTDEGWAPCKGPVASLPDGDAADWTAAMLGLRDFVTKNGFKGVVIDLSDGIDAAITAALAVDALGADAVHCVLLPGTGAARENLADAADVAGRLGVRCDTLPVAPAMEGIAAQLAPLFGGEPFEMTESLGSRLRGTALMAIADKSGGMVVTGASKSALTVGHPAPGGDVNGGFNPVKDLYGSEIVRLCRWRNAHRSEGALGPDGVVIPEQLIDSPPPAVSQAPHHGGALPPRETLDAILRRLIEDEASIAEIVAEGFDEAAALRIEHLVRSAEPLRRRAAPGVMIAPRSLARHRRFPLTNRYRDV